MEDVLCFFSYAFFAVELLVLFVPALLLIVFGLGWAAMLARSEGLIRVRRALRWTLLQLLIPITILWVGVLLRERGSEAEPPKWPVHLINSLLWGHVPLPVVLVWSLREARGFVFFLSLAVFGYSLSAAVVSGMAVTGAWL
jgi:hypothetical protein